MSARMLAACALLLVVSGCKGTESGPALALRFELEDTSAIARLDYEITGSALAGPVTGSVEIINSIATAVLELPVGTGYGILLRAFNDADNPICVGSGGFDISEGLTTNVPLTLICSTSAGQPEGTVNVVTTFMLNVCPVVTVLDVSPQDVLLGQSAAVTVTANDPEGGLLTYTWSTTAGNGTFADPNAAGTTYTCDTGSPHNIQIDVSDGDSACVQTRALVVNCTSDQCGGVNCDDGNECTVNPACDALTGMCPAAMAVATGTACDFAAMGDGFCDDSQVCVECLADTDCPDDGSECTTPSTCGAGVCSTPTNVALDTPCDSGGGPGSGVCDGAGVCGSDLCAGPPVVVCDDGNQCTDDPACVQLTGLCPAPTNALLGTRCDRLGTLDGVCDGAGTCIGCVINADCSDDANDCTTPSTCNAGMCSAPINVAPGITCNLMAGGTGVCDGVGLCIPDMCVGPPVVTCDDSNQCTTDGTCNSVTGCPASTPVASGTACDFVGVGDGLCDGANTCVECLAAGDCADDGNECTTPAVCTANACTTTDVPAETPCDSGGGPGSGVCSGTGVCGPDLCVGPPAVVCDDGNLCTTDPACEPVGGTCPTPTPTASGSVCDFAGVGDGLCDGSGVCLECLAANDCPDDGNQCTQPLTCTGGACSTVTNEPSGVTCDFVGVGDGLCDGSGLCVECLLGTDCPDDGNQCTVPATCTAGACDVPANATSGTACDSGNGPASGTCDGAGACDPLPVEITGITPPGELPGTTVALEGTAFVPGMVVDFGGSNVTATNVTATTADVVLPSLAPGNVNVVGLGGSAFVYTMGPTISSIMPTTGSPGSSVTITGTGFRAGTVSCPETGLRGIDNGSTNFTPPSFAGNAIFPAGAISVDTNGYVAVAGSAPTGGALNQVLPNAPHTAQTFFPFWDDLDNNPAIGQVYVAERNVLGVNTLIVQWDNFAHFNNVGDGTVQLQIHEAGATGGALARFAYQDVTFGDPATDGGASSTVGYQQAPTIADQFLFDSGVASIADGDLVTLTATAGGGNVVDFAQTSDAAAFVDIANDSDVFITWSGAGSSSCITFLTSQLATSEVPLVASGADTVTVSIQGRASSGGVVHTAP